MLAGPEHLQALEQRLAVDQQVGEDDDHAAAVGALGYAAEDAMTLAAYNAGASRVEDWTKISANPSQMSEQSFLEKISIPSTKSYVTSILERYKAIKKAK